MTKFAVARNQSKSRADWQGAIIKQLCDRPWVSPPFSGSVSKDNPKFLTAVRRLQQKGKIVILSEDGDRIHIQLAGVDS